MIETKQTTKFVNQGFVEGIVHDRYLCYEGHGYNKPIFASEDTMELIDGVLYYGVKLIPTREPYQSPDTKYDFKTTLQRTMDRELSPQAKEMFPHLCRN